MVYPNWFAHYAQGFFEKHLAEFVGKPGLRFLQVGAFTGDASVWLVENVLTRKGSALWDVDSWLGSDEPEHEPFNWSDVKREYMDKTAAARAVGRIHMSRDFSSEFFANWGYDPFFDFIYIDGDHTPQGVLEDAVHAIPLLKVGGLIAFDDYQWKHPATGLGPGVAIDAVEQVYAGKLQLIQSGLQAWFRKVAP